MKIILLIFVLIFAPASAAGQEPSLFERLEQESKDLKLTRDPFTLGAVISTDVSPYGLHLSGIVWDQESPQAIINDIIVGVGDKVGSNIVVEIKQEKVILFDGTNHLELRLGQ